MTVVGDEFQWTTTETVPLVTGRISPEERRQVAIHLYATADGNAVPLLARMLNLTAGDARALVAALEEADRKGGYQTRVRHRADGDQGRGGDSRRRVRVADGDGGQGADEVGTRRCPEPLCRGAQVPVSGFGLVRGGPRRICRACTRYRVTLERAHRTEWMREYRARRRQQKAPAATDTEADRSGAC